MNIDLQGINLTVRAIFDSLYQGVFSMRREVLS